MALGENEWANKWLFITLIISFITKLLLWLVRLDNINKKYLIQIIIPGKFGPSAETPGTLYVTVVFLFGIAKKNSFCIPMYVARSMESATTYENIHDTFWISIIITKIWYLKLMVSFGVNISFLRHKQTLGQIWCIFCKKEFQTMKPCWIKIVAHQQHILLKILLHYGTRLPTWNK